MNNKYKDIERTSDNLYQIYLYKEDGSWYRAYGWSAYLATIYAQKELKPVAKEDDNGDIVAFVGIPSASFKNYFDSVDVEGSDDNIIIKLTDDFKENNVFNEENYLNIFNEWKSTLPVSKNKKPKKRPSDGYTPNVSYNNVPFAPNNMLSIMGKIISYDMAAHSLIEQSMFLNDIKKEIGLLMF